jgi:thiamine-phosphate pyrophosphorylase
MHELYTPAVARALEGAVEWARRHGVAAVDPLHILLALLQEDEGRAAVLCATAGLPSAHALAHLTAGTVPVATPGPAPLFSPRADEAVRSARVLAREFFGEQTVASEQLLLALLREDEPLRRNVEALGLSFARLESEVLAMQAPPIHLDEPLDLREPAEEMDVARILDASANRAREALRVLEDYCRFTLDDVLLSKELKELRHDLSAALGDLPANWLLAARDTLGDVGTNLSTAAELTRSSAQAVVQANLKRLQEACRSLEEFGKVFSPELGEAVEALRYRSYTLERALVLGATARARLAEARLYVLVTGALCAGSLERTVCEAAAGGAQVIQLREKEMADGELLERARQVRRWTRAAGVLFIMNDRPDLARMAEADGVHLGQDELPVKEARRVVGPDALIGVSTHNLDQVRRAVLDGASYIGVGPTFPSGTKQFEEFAGLEFVKQATATTSLPAFAIGGVNLKNLPEVIAAGARRVAVSGAICRAEAPAATAAALRQVLDAQ